VREAIEATRVRMTPDQIRHSGGISLFDAARRYIPVILIVILLLVTSAMAGLSIKFSYIW
jgi:hypothetical protein